MTKIEFSNVWAEHVFETFYTMIISDGGDGGGVLVCKNFAEACQWFQEWYVRKFNRGEIFKPGLYFREETEDQILYHDGNENFMFTDKMVDFGHGDCTFVIKEDCPFGWTVRLPDTRNLIAI